MTARNIVLIGLPGAGKSALGFRLARRLARPFIDIDAAVEELSGRTVQDIFTEDGETTFRSWEAEAVGRCVGFRDTVIATGGGTVLDPKNVSSLKRDGLLFFIDATPKSILRRSTLADRPLVCHDMEKLNALYHRRRGIYLSAADATVPNDKGRLRRALLHTINLYQRMEPCDF